MKVGVVGGGIIGYCSAYYLQKSGHEVTIFEKSNEQDSPSYWNAGMVVPSHFIPLSSPGVISQGLRWMFRADSPFYIKPKLDRDLISWGLKFYKAATKSRVKIAAPLLNELLINSRALITEILQQESIDAGFSDKGLMIYCKTQKLFFY